MANAQPNILLIPVDDLNNRIGTLSSEAAYTPNLDSLAQRATLFERAYCSAPACGPSRASLLTGLLPSTSGFYYNSQPILAEQKAKNSKPISLPAHFKSNGYTVGLYGKIFHTANRGDQLSQVTSPGYFADHRGFWANIPDSVKASLTDYRHEGGSNFAWGPVPDAWEKEHPLVDTENTDHVIRALGQNHEKPFLLCLGYLRPHLPWVAPQRFFDRYPLEDIRLPSGYQEGDLEDLPQCAQWMAQQVPGNGLGDSYLQKAITEGDDWKKAIQAYLASISHMDEQLGRVLQVLDKSPYADNTIVILASDHGYHLGEKEHWTKFGLWEQTLQIPLLVALPKQKAQTTRTPVSLVDLFPTLISLAGIDAPNQQLDGIDLSPVLENANQTRGRPVVSTYGYNNHSIRSEQFRYICYRNGDEELYDHAEDPHEFTNLAGDPALQTIIKMMRSYLPAKNVPETNSGSNLGWDPNVFEDGYTYTP